MRIKGTVWKHRKEVQVGKKSLSGPNCSSALKDILSSHGIAHMVLPLHTHTDVTHLLFSNILING